MKANLYADDESYVPDSDEGDSDKDDYEVNIL